MCKLFVLIIVFIWNSKCVRGVFIFLYKHLKLSQTLENSACYCYTSYEMTDNFFMISDSNQQLLQQLEYTLLKPDCHSWWIFKNEIWHFRRTICNKIQFQTWKKCRHRNVWNASHSFWSILHESNISFLSCIRDSRKAGSLWGMMRRCGRSKEVNTTELIWPKGLG